MIPPVEIVYYQQHLWVSSKSAVLPDEELRKVVVDSWLLAVQELAQVHRRDHSSGSGQPARENLVRRNSSRHFEQDT